MNRVVVFVLVCVAMTLVFNVPNAEARRKKTVTKRLVEIQAASNLNNTRLANVALSAETSLQKLDELLLRIQEQGFTSNTIVAEILQVRESLLPLVSANTAEGLENPFLLIQDVQRQFRSPEIDFEIRSVIDGEDFREALRRLKQRREDENNGGLQAQAIEIKGDLVDAIVNVSALRIGPNLDVPDESEEDIRQRLESIPDVLFIPLVAVADTLERISNGLSRALTLYNDLNSITIDGVSPFDPNFINDDGPICDLADAQANRIFRASLQLKVYLLYLRPQVKNFQERIPRSEVQVGVHGYTGSSLVVTRPITNAAGKMVSDLEAVKEVLDILGTVVGRRDQFCSDGPDPFRASLEAHRILVEGGDYSG